jgi:hypothetical protein
MKLREEPTLAAYYCKGRAGGVESAGWSPGGGGQPDSSRERNSIHREIDFYKVDVDYRD